jgi:hypothetical protein
MQPINWKVFKVETAPCTSEINNFDRTATIYPGGLVIPRTPHKIPSPCKPAVDLRQMQKYNLNEMYL